MSLFHRDSFHRGNSQSTQDYRGILTRMLPDIPAPTLPLRQLRLIITSFVRVSRGSSFRETTRRPLRVSKDHRKESTRSRTIREMSPETAALNSAAVNTRPIFSSVPLSMGKKKRKRKRSTTGKRRVFAAMITVNWSRLFSSDPNFHSCRALDLVISAWNFFRLHNVGPPSNARSPFTAFPFRVCVCVLRATLKRFSRYAFAFALCAQIAGRRGKRCGHSRNDEHFV